MTAIPSSTRTRGSCRRSRIADAIERDLKVMDATALSLCRENHLPIYVFEQAAGNIRRILSGERLGTIISTRKES